MPYKYSGAPTIADVIGMGQENSKRFGEEMQNLGNQKHQEAMLKKQHDYEQQTQAGNIQKFKELISGTKPGEKINFHLGAKGEVSGAHAEESPYKYMFGQEKAKGSAQSNAFKVYMHALPEVQKRFSAAQEGLEAVNDPNQISSIGQAKTLMIKNLGMNRYNQQEGNALVPPQLSGIMHQIYNTLGNDQNPLTDSQRKALNAVFQNSLGMARKQHENAKNNAHTAYKLSGFYDPASGEAFKQQVGADFDKQLNDATERFKAVPSNPGYQPSSQPQQPKHWYDSLLPSRSPQPQQPQQSPQGGGFDPDAYLRGSK